MKKYLNKILIACSIILALVAIFMLFAPAITYTPIKTPVIYTGAQAAFGYKEPNTGLEILKASANVVPYILLLVGVVFSVIAALGKFTKFAALVAAGCLLVAGVFFFLTVQLSSPVATGMKEVYELGVGAIIGGVASLLAALTSAAAAVVKAPKSKKRK